MKKIPTYINLGNISSPYITANFTEVDWSRRSNWAFPNDGYFPQHGVARPEVFLMHLLGLSDNKKFGESGRKTFRNPPCFFAVVCPIFWEDHQIYIWPKIPIRSMFVVYYLPRCLCCLMANGVVKGS